MKAYPEAYSKELDRLLVFSEVPAPRPQNEYYVIRNQKGNLLAAGVCLSSWLHPRRLRFYIAVEPLYQRRGLGTMLFDRMRVDHPNAKWQGCADLDNDAAEWWLRGLGFEFLCRQYCLDAMVVDLEESSIYDLPLVRYEQLDSLQRDYLISMVWTDYIKKHENIDPLNEEIDAETFRAVALIDLDEHATCCLMENGEIQAYAVCGAADDWTTGVKYVGSRLADSKRFHRFLADFANRCFEDKGGLMIDADSFDPDALMLLRLFGDLPDDSYDTYYLE